MMKSLQKIIIRSILLAATIAFTLLCLNILFIIQWLMHQPQDLNPSNSQLLEISNGLTVSDNGFILSAESEALVNQLFSFAFLIDPSGRVVWEMNKPDELPDSYSINDVASFSRWYLNDYPVWVWQNPQGLLVFGNQPGSYWRYNLGMPEVIIGHIPENILYALILNVIAAFCLAILLGIWLYRKLNPLSRGIADLSSGKVIELSTRGITAELSKNLNHTSQILNEQDQRLKKRDLTRTQWIAGISHDIRTPLSMILGYASDLENNLDSSHSKQAHIICEKTLEIKNLIENLNLASKLEYELQPIHYESVLFAPLLREVAADFINQGLPDQYEMSLIIDAKSESFSLSGDRQLLKRMILNLLQNATCHNPDGCDIEICFEIKNENALFTLSDNGQGFAKDTLKQLNTPFTNAPLEKHGLGLIIVRQIVKAHGGFIHFENRSGAYISIQF
ncbi:ATP-binding protein [Eubacteriaceae bacterium ES2]|nr:ATP-binding protein [Eubacteriaceae bacterium ES2]